MTTEKNRRELATRQISFFQQFTKKLVQFGLTPNQVSVGSMLFALLGFGLSTQFTGRDQFTQTLILIGMALSIQGRLLCNMIDGLMAVEGGQRTVTGEIFNDLPDRISDILLVMASGFILRHAYPWAWDLAWLSAILAILTAYIRILGVTLTGKQDFSGPLAKQHRMFILTLGLLLYAFEINFLETRYSLIFALVIIGIGSFFTCIRRLKRLVQNLKVN